MAKIILARTEDSGMKKAVSPVVFVLSLITALPGIPVGAILSGVMQRILKNSSMPVQYGFFLGPIFIGMLIGFIYAKSSIDTKNHTICEKCKGKMQPMTKMDSIFMIPARNDQTYDDAFHYLAENMAWVPSVSSITDNRRGCYVCCYQCEQCRNRIIRIKDFLPVRGTCMDKETYYFDFMEFSLARGREDLLG